MSAPGRPVLVQPGQRVILVAPRPEEGDQSLARTLDTIASFGWTLVGVIPPERHQDAIRLVLDGKADAVIAARPEYVPMVRFTGDLVQRPGSARTQRIPRDLGPMQPTGAVALDHRRPRLVETESAEPVAPQRNPEQERTQLLDRGGEQVPRDPDGSPEPVASRSVQRRTRPATPAPDHPWRRWRSERLPDPDRATG